MNMLQFIIINLTIHFILLVCIIFYLYKLNSKVDKVIEKKSFFFDLLASIRDRLEK